MDKHWEYAEEANIDLVNTVVETMGVSKIIAEMLVRRGITTEQEAEVFFNPKREHLHDPFLMKDMDKAVERIHKALRDKERILVYGDYDVDGTTAVAILFSFLTSQPGVKQPLDVDSRQIYYRIPDRYKEGYGLNFEAIEYAKARQFKLIITLDCGIKANKEIELANSYGIDVIVGDHHRLGEEIPAGYAVLDPRRPDCEYPYKELSGCGVSFKIIQAYTKKYELPVEPIYEYLDLVAISIAADIVPITDENRVMAYLGLEKINNNPRSSIKALMLLSGKIKQRPQTDNTSNLFFDKKITISDLMFFIGPRINAAGRMGRDDQGSGDDQGTGGGKNAVRLLVTDDEERVAQFSQEIDNQNEDRKKLDQKATDEALAQINSNHQIEIEKNTTVLYNKDWHEGIIGIVASRLIETYYRPTIVFTQSGEFIKGSARSVRGFDIYEAIDQCRDLIEHWGGHKYAAGLTIKPENLEPFKQKFEECVTQLRQGVNFVQTIKIETEVSLDKTEPKIETQKTFNAKLLMLFEDLERFEPFGPRNLKPVFFSKGVDSGNSKIVADKHLRLSINYPNSNIKIDGIAFGQADKWDLVSSGQPFEICYTFEKNKWKDIVSIQMNVKDIRPVKK
ncbi:single-stranded-DNA-specific exonuclease RecJ [Bacteroidia bacterium]|nr:single-stranded-DNA-specific exonuclease RecJ [Bacteroidia bacterium]